MICQEVNHSNRVYAASGLINHAAGFEDIVKRYKLTAEQRLEDALSGFESYRLDELNNANLMDRVDSKFLLPISFLPTLLEQLQGHYKVLNIAGQRCFTYHNQYLDTPDMAMYQAHHNGKLNRFKVRRRHYVDTATEFLEVKFKNNQKRTIKTRIKLSGEEEQQPDIHEFIQDQMGDEQLDLKVVQRSGYKRIALANEEKAERLTLDFSLWYQDEQGQNEVTLPKFFIAELKQQKKSKRSVFYQLMSANNIFTTSFSKYCIGCALLFPTSLKSNRFKSVLMQLDRLPKPFSY
ncbi:polyphosphate polymerase domain-containing protein [Paraglaciecola sp.]|uniref:polyphosphate polymerase domain-containing protein n=1 Tax=Paraglaciecola sp. TaxID=1920173 RepID=UPI003EF316E9